MVEVEHGVEDQEIATHGFAAPHGIVGEENNVAFAVGDVDDGGLFGDFVGTGDHAAEEQIFFGGEAQDDAGLLVLGRKRKAGKFLDVFGDVKFLLVRSAFYRFLRRLIRASLDDVGIGSSATSTGAPGAAGAFVRSTSATGAAEISADGDDRTLSEIDVEFVVVAVSDGTFLIVNGGENDAAGSLHGAGIGDIHPFGHAASDGKRGASLYGDEQAALTDKALEIGEALVAEATANVVGGVKTWSDKVWSIGGIFPGTRIAAHRQAAKNGTQSGRTTAPHGRKDDDVEFFAEVLVFAQPGIGDIGVWDFQLFHGDAEPAVVLSVLPIVDEGDARCSKRMSL